MLGSVGVWTELGLLGALGIVLISGRVPQRNADVAYWICAVAGTLLTPYVIGVPVFGYAFLELLDRAIARSTLRPAHPESN